MYKFDITEVLNRSTTLMIYFCG